MKTWLTASLLALVAVASRVQAQAAGPSADLINQLAQTLGSTPEQATGAAGAVFAAAKTKMTPADWSKVEAAVPDVNDMMAKVPARPEAQAATDAQSAYGIRGSTSLPGAFSRVGLSGGDQIEKTVTVVDEYVSKTAGPDIGKAFSDALK